MTAVLSKLLEYGFAGPSKQKKLLSTSSFRKTLEGRKAYDREGKCLGDAYKYLLQSEATAIADSTLVQEEVYKTIIEGAEPFKCFRDAFPIIKFKTPLSGLSMLWPSPKTFANLKQVLLIP